MYPLCARHNMCLLYYCLQITNETAEVQDLNYQMNDGMNEHDVEQSLGSWYLRCLANLVTTSPAESRECCVCLGFPAHNFPTTQGSEPFPKPQSNWYETWPLLWNPANHPEPCCPGPPEYHSAFEKFISSSLPEALLLCSPGLL